MKKLITILLALTLLLSFSAFAQDAQTPVAEAPAETSAEGTETEFEGPYIITTCGQSPGAVMISMAAKQEGIEAAHENTLTAEQLKEGDYKTLIITTGTSMKGMGAAGTDVDTEIARCLELIEAAKEAEITIIGAHVEGMARRTDSSDTASIEAIMEHADIILVIEESDSDGYFTEYAKEHEKPLLTVQNALEIGTVLK
ncbi:MAG: hypothetical protein GX786_01735 [Clostridiales bacterium]|nr:hypothetical protein [Clostridiales bacterium]